MDFYVWFTFERSRVHLSTFHILPAALTLHMYVCYLMYSLSLSIIRYMDSFGSVYNHFSFACEWPQCYRLGSGCRRMASVQIDVNEIAHNTIIWYTHSDLL